MKGVWHIARKDLRRYAAPAVLWLAFVTGTAVWFWTATDVTPSYSLFRFSRLDVVFGVVRAVQLITAALLVGALVLEDSLVGAEMFWRSRPIGRTSLLAAKTTGAGLLFVVGPILALVPVWLGIGFGGNETVLAAAEFAREQAGVTLFALMVGALSRGLGGFIFAALAVMLVQIGAAWWWTDKLAASDHGPRTWVAGMSVVGSVAVIGHQFLTLRRGRSWLLLAAAVTVSFVLSFGGQRSDGDRKETRTADEIPGATSWLEERAKRIARGEEPSTTSGRIVGELAVREGAKFAVGANRVSILEIVPGWEGNPTTVLLEERDAWLALREGSSHRGQDALARTKSRGDVWVLRTRAPDRWQVLQAEERGTAIFASMIAGVRRLVLPSDLNTAELGGAVLIKVRFGREGDESTNSESNAGGSGARN